MVALDRLQMLSADLTDSEPPDPSWTEQLLRRIAADARPGADFTLLATDEGDEILMTEGALRSLIRAAGDVLPGTLVGRIRFRRDLDAPELPLTIETDVVLAYGVPMERPWRRSASRSPSLSPAIPGSPHPRVDVRVRDVIIAEEDA